MQFYFPIADIVNIIPVILKPDDALEKLDPDRIYVENIRSILNINTRFAKLICELAVRKGYFKAYYAVTCKNENCGVIISDLNLEESDIPEELICEQCMEDGNDYSFDKNEVEIIKYYKYKENSYNK